MKIEIDSRTHATIRLALVGWKARCEAEAKQMDEWAKEYQDKGKSDTAAQCVRNAAASRGFIADADAALAKLGR